ncbi:ceramide synthase 2-like [Tubulanus polymorphus]|uniref:ceramide synthase 2-like n=1 Tax=Tubulanus polymorphus TaxID=672921 RepID=UPI003DA449BA
MAELVEWLKSSFWNEKFWFPEGKSWKLLENVPVGKYYPQVSDLYMIIPMAVLLTFIRFVFERYVARPIAKYHGLREGRVLYPERSVVLEKAFKKLKNPDNKQLQDLTKRTDFTLRQVERWFRKRRNLDRASEIKKFTETAWRFLFYFLIFVYGFITQTQKPWFYDTAHCWIDWPLHHVTDDMYWYYMVSFGFYFSLIFSLFLDVRRKDFGEQVVHHITTILLMFLSWCNNFLRMGSLILVLHDAVDYWMEGAKLAKYLKYDRLCDTLFVIFAIVWFFTRLLLYPIKILHAIFIIAPQFCGMAPVYYPYVGLLSCLQVLHLIWFYLICKAAYIAIRTGKIQKDSRSETEEPVSSEEERGRGNGGGGVDHQKNNGKQHNNIDTNANQRINHKKINS